MVPLKIVLYTLSTNYTFSTEITEKELTEIRGRLERLLNRDVIPKNINCNYSKF